MVERYIRDVEVAGSNPVASIFFALFFFGNGNKLFEEKPKILLTDNNSYGIIIKSLNNSEIKYRGVAQLGRALH